MKKNKIEKEKKENTKSKKKKIILIVVAIILVLIICIAIGIYYFYKTEEQKISEINKLQEKCLLDLTENINYGEEILYEDLIIKLVDTSKLQENTNIIVKINENELLEGEKYTFNELGIYKINIKLEYTYNYSILKSISKLIKNEKTIEINIEDTEKPIISGVSNKEITEGEEINLLEGITATDNIDGEIEVTIEGSVDNTKAGEYIIKVIATDKSGNTEEATFIVTVKEKPKAQANNSSNRKNNNTAQNSSGGSNQEARREFTLEELLAEANVAKSTYRSQINTVLEYTNRYRQEVGQANLVLDETLTKAACARAIEMAHSGITAHTRPDGRSYATIFDEVNVVAFAYGENIAWGWSTPQRASEEWRNSPGHYANMTRDFFGKIGIGVYRLNGTYYWVQLFTD